MISQLPEDARRPFRWLVGLDSKSLLAQPNEQELALYLLASLLLEPPEGAQWGMSMDEAMLHLVTRFPELKTSQVLSVLSIGLANRWLASSDDLSQPADQPNVLAPQVSPVRLHQLSAPPDTELATLVTVVQNYRAGGEVYIGNDTEPQFRPRRVTMGEEEVEMAYTDWHTQAVGFVGRILGHEAQLYLVLDQLPRAIERRRRGEPDEPVLDIIREMLAGGESNNFAVAEIILATLWHVQEAIERQRQQQKQQPDE